jgi:flagellar hook-associated protein FlgK
MNRPRPAQTKISHEDNLLDDLDKICNYVIGNQDPVEVSFNERATLPESLSYIMIYPTNQTAVKEAVEKMKKLVEMVNTLNKKILQMNYKIDLKKSKFSK